MDAVDSHTVRFTLTAPWSGFPVLLAGLKEDMAAAAAAPEGEEVGLDFDPFLDAQDPADRYEVKSVSKKGTKYLADVYCKTEGKWSD